MNNIIELLTFIPWILYFVEIIYHDIAIIENNNYDKKQYIKYVNNNLFKSINILELALYFIFTTLILFENVTIIKIIFPLSYIIILGNFFMKLAPECKKIKHKGIMVLTIILLSSIIIHFMIFNNLILTYNLMFIVSIFSSFLVLLLSYLFK